MKTTYVTIMASRKDGTLIIGVTDDLVRRVWEHKMDDWLTVNRPSRRR